MFLAKLTKPLTDMLLKLAHCAVNTGSLYFIADCRAAGMEHCVQIKLL